MLEKINSPKDLKKLHIDELETLAGEVRSEIIKTTLRNGGHLASNLGSVELTLAMHYVFDAPEDKIVFDVGHQSYTHKLITGRRDEFYTLRKKDGISGFPNHNESEYDTFDAGHASAAISAALGLARARDIKKEHYNVVAVVGDGAIAGGMAFEALNDAGSSKETNLIIILNDNEMSISKNVGALSTHFSKLRAAKGYLNSKRHMRTALNKLNHSGRLLGALSHIRNTVRYFLVGETVFDSMGIKYLGPINGHSIKDMVAMLRRAKEQTGPVLIHAVTCKGCGYNKAEDNPEIYHGVSPKKGGTLERINYADRLGESLCELAENDDRICAITAGMKLNTGLKHFAEKFPERFFDTGIAEEHALAMAGGLAKGGMKPYVVIYSTFLQRGFDQLFHDVCLQETGVTVCIDHAGLTGEDGRTHQGIYDIGFLRAMPNLTILAPRDTDELERMLKYAQKSSQPVAIRYPKGGMYTVNGEKPFEKPEWDILYRGNSGSVLAFSACIEEALNVAEQLDYSLIDARSIKPLDEQMLKMISDKPICIIEDNASAGGLNEAVLDFYSKNSINAKVYGFSLKDEFVPCASVKEQLKDNLMDSEYIIEKIKQNEA